MKKMFYGKSEKVLSHIFYFRLGMLPNSLTGQLKITILILAIIQGTLFEQTLLSIIYDKLALGL